MTTFHDVIFMTPCDSLEAKPSFAAFAPVGFVFEDVTVYNPFLLPNGDGLEPLACGFEPVPGTNGKLRLPVPDGGFVLIEQHAGKRPFVCAQVTRVDAKSRILATFLSSQLPRAGDLSIAKLAQRYITPAMMELLSFKFEGTSIADAYLSDCGRFSAFPVEYGFVQAINAGGIPYLTRSHEDGGGLELTYVESVDGCEAGPLLTRYDAAGNVMAAAMVSHIRAMASEL